MRMPWSKKNGKGKSIKNDKKRKFYGGDIAILIFFIVIISVAIFFLKMYWPEKSSVEITNAVDQQHSSAISWFWIIGFLIVCILVFILLFNSKEEKGAKKGKPVNTPFLPMNWSRAIGTILGLAVVGFGIWLLWIHYHSDENESMAVPPVEHTAATPSHEWFDEDESYEKVFTRHFTEGEVKQYKYVGQRYAYWPKNPGETAEVTVRDRKGTIVFRETVTMVTKDSLHREPPVFNGNSKEYGQIYYVSCNGTEELNSYKQKE